VHQTRLLARAFFSRLFESDLMPDGLPQVQLVIWGMLLAATPPAAYAVLMPIKYAKAQFFRPLGPEFDADRLILVTLTMIVMGVVGLFIWDGVFPDRRDVRILGVLPVPVHRFVAARLAALGRVFVLFAMPLCVMQSVVFGLTVSGYGEPIGRFHGIAAHFVAVLLACTFVFCALVAAQCLLLVIFGRRAAQAASMAFQVLFAVGLVQMLFFLPDLIRALRAGGPTHEGAAALAVFPPAWFFAIYEQLSGSGSRADGALAGTAILVTIAATMLAPALYGASYSYLSQRALEGPAMRATGSARTNRARARLARSVSRPLAGAIRWFTLRTLFRSRSHRMMFAVYAGFALAIDVSSALSLALRKGLAGFQEPGPEMMSMPLVVQFLLLAALRVITAVPSDPKARWIFRACEPAGRPAAVAGARDAMIVLVVLPTTVMALVQGLFWPVGTAVAHAAFVFVLGRLLAELLTPQTGKLPFACTYLPGKSRIFALWPVYLLLFFIYTVVFAAIDLALSRRPGKLVWFCLVATLAAQVVVFIRRRAVTAMPGLRFDEEDPTAIFQGFQLSEGLAAAPRTESISGFASDSTELKRRAQPSA
jgi:hypothetical protein